MLKILYAASNNENAKLQLARFMRAMHDKPHIIKIAAYKQSSPPINIDWTLDCLLNVFNPEQISLDSDNLRTYFKQVKHFNPDLIISDLEYFTSQIANKLNITLWQCSSSLINFALTRRQKYNLGLFKKYSYIFNRNPHQIQRTANCIDNSNCNMIYSHLGDIVSPPEINSGFEWVRPYHQIGKPSVPCQHNVVAGLLCTNKKILNILKEYPDSVGFTEFQGEIHPNLLMKDLANEEEYYCNLKNSKLFVCEGQTTFLADAFYNNKYSAVYPNINDTECIINSTISEKMKLSTSIYSSSNNLLPLMDLPVEHAINPHIKYLHERIEEL